ncbi:PREDICTED: uncharacterized protein LOC104748626 [Camelina sativa]|uniref:Uncharacterized protein LOC104748626 n=1 Tax=Camelina sativa TaxID=90675 RepID=A0ABM0WBB8_CAMSA|nr:PREDICTED: uncharacterized protein LOC104748626 [Camelina sativa]
MDCGLLDFPFLGDCLSLRGWCDKKPIRCRFDRALGNKDWHDLVPDTVTEYLPMIASDHMTLVTSIGAKRLRGRRSFMFDRRWVGKAGLMEAISSGWHAEHDPGSAGFVDKIVSCRRAISRWRKAQVPYGRDLIEDLKWDEEIHLYQKSRNRWMRVEDKNTKYFQVQTKQQRARNRIVGLYNKQDVWSTEDEDICDMAVSYFEELFTSINPDNFEYVLREVNTVITDADNTRLTAPATEAEVRQALFMMHPDKAPGPDRMTSLFFKKARTVVKADLVSMVNQFLEEGVFDKDLNRTHICLIPKVVKPTRMAELRPISLCNVGYKVISKVLCQRLKVFLPGLISETQTAFVPGRLISDNILIAQEMFHGLRTNHSCKEVLIANIRKAEADKRITGIKVANKCPPITHLLFADDSLFFCKVDKDQCLAILEILRQYEGVSGQQFNLAKSSIQLGHTVDTVVQTEIQGVLGITNRGLGITNLGGMGSYLGIPESLGGSKIKVFSYVRDRLQSHTTGWSARLLSKGGKEVMVKSVAMAVPTFVMSCYRLPKTITSKLTSAVANFWWSTNGQSGGMHWIAWERLYCSKQLGGLGFKRVDDFNTALLAKQLWKLIEFPDSLFARVFKSRYYRNSDPMDPIRSYSPSYGWRSIVSARSLVNKGLITRVGSGTSIFIWSDPWIPAQFPRPALSNGPFKDPNLRIPHLIDRYTNSWRKDLLTQHFDSMDDYLGWHFTKTGKYTVKSGYEMARSDVQGPFRALGSGPEITSLLARVWKVWALANVPVGPHLIPTGSVYTNLDHFLDLKGPGSHISAFPWLMWYIWKARNARVFENLDELPNVVVRVAEGEAVTWQEAQDGVVSRHKTPPGVWSDQFPVKFIPLHAEVEAFLWTMHCMIGHEFWDVVFLTDCSDLVKMVSSPTDWPAFATYLDDTRMDREEFTSFSLLFVPRQANVRADSLARQARVSL